MVNLRLDNLLVLSGLRPADRVAFCDPGVFKRTLAVNGRPVLLPGGAFSLSRCLCLSFLILKVRDNESFYLLGPRLEETSRLSFKHHWRVWMWASGQGQSSLGCTGPEPVPQLESPD